MTNIRDIAKKTGYSVSTVSRVLNNHPYVSEEKRQKILQVIQELNYIPNHMARNLSYGSSKNIGVIVPYLDHPYFDQLVSGIIDAAFDAGYKVTLLPTNYEAKTELAYLKEFAAKGFDGLIITSRSNPLAKIAEFNAYGPITFCEKVTGFSCAYINREASFKAAFTYLKQAGKKRLGLTLGRDKKISYNSKITIELAQKYFPTFDLTDIYWNCVNETGGMAAGEFFKTRQVDCILTNSDTVAAGIYESYQPEPLPLIIGRDNLLVGKVLALTTIDHHLAQCGQSAVELLFEADQKKIQMPYEFITR